MIQQILERTEDPDARRTRLTESYRYYQNHATMAVASGNWPEALACIRGAQTVQAHLAGLPDDVPPEVIVAAEVLECYDNGRPLSKRAADAAAAILGNR